MTDHTWVLENIPAYLSGGLGVDEVRRLQDHVDDCAECADSLAESQELDGVLNDLFASSRPAPGLEDRVVNAVRVARKPTMVFTGWAMRATKIAASVIVLATFGLLIAAQATDGRLPMPGDWNRTRVARADHDAQAAKDLTNEDPGIDRELEASVDVERIDQQVVEARVTDDVIGSPTRERYERRDGMWMEAKTDHWYKYGGQATGGIGGFGGIGGIGGGFGGGGFGGGGVLNWSSPTLNGGTLPPTSGPQSTASSTTFYFRPGDAKSPPVATPASKVSGEQVASTAPTRSSNVTTLDSRNPADVLLSFQLQRDELAQKFGANHPELQAIDGRMRMLERLVQQQAAGKPVRPEDLTAAIADVPAPAARRVVLRSGDIEFEIESFDSAHATVTKLVLEIEGAFVATVNSDKLPNGKVKGSITVRVPPEKLDGLVLDLRRELGKGGELKGVKITSQDVTKQYTDLESRLRAARTMETRLLQIIKEGKGEIKDLLVAEKELGVWRTRIEEIEGELRYYSNLASLSTLTIALSEKELRAAAGISENERVQAGVEVEDVDKTYQHLLAAIAEAKGRVTKAELKQLAAGQFNATLNFEVAPDQAGPLRDRLRQVGRVARLEIDRTQQAVGGTLPTDAKVTRGDTLFFVQLYNLANIQPRETITLQVAVPEVPAAYQSLRDAVSKAAGRVLVAQLNEQDRQNVTAQLYFDVRRSEEATLRAALDSAGEAVSRNVVRAPESDTVTDVKVLYQVNLFGLNRIKPRETVSLQVAAANVPAAYQTLRDAVAKAAGQVLEAKLNEKETLNPSAKFQFAVKRSEEPTIRAALEAAGEAVSREVVRAAENETTTDAKVFYDVTLTGANRLKPRETTTMTVEVADVDGAAAVLTAQAGEVKARLADSKSDRDRSGKATVRLVYDVPLASAAGLVEKMKASGSVKALQASRDANAPDGKLATARIDVTLTGGERIVANDAGFWPPIQKGLQYSASFLLTSMTWVVFALCIVLPWALLLLVGYRLLRRLWRRSGSVAV